jgi:hypothetical protein
MLDLRVSTGDTFDLLYERIERLKQLIATIELKEVNRSRAS